MKCLAGHAARGLGTAVAVKTGMSSALPIVHAPPNPHFTRFGGEAAVRALVAAFYRAMDTRPEAATIRAMHDADLRETQRILVAYLCEWMGGPKAYSAERGAPMLRRRHAPFDIDAAARDAWMGCMRQALAETCADEGLRAELDAAFYKIADFIRNTEGSGQARPHPGRPRDTQPGEPGAPHTSSPHRSPR